MNTCNNLSICTKPPPIWRLLPWFQEKIWDSQGSVFIFTKALFRNDKHLSIYIQLLKILPKAICCFYG